ncbi:MAG: hypothetical protein RMM53_00625 [Bacteroidia bacterium]|nr:hypothetical protein [Bacteroidia bacterium]MDW8332699.1 hypothetical protein [Bacteroidia bacterium]
MGKKILSALWLLQWAANGWAQIDEYRDNFARSFDVEPLRIRGTTKWSWISSGKFDVYYAGANQNLALNTARMLAAYYEEFAELFDYRPSSRYRVHVYPTTAAFASAPDPAHPRFYADHSSHIFSVYFPGSYVEYGPMVRTALVRALLDEMTYGGMKRTAMQNRLLLYQHAWYSEGLSRFLGEGWTNTDEMILSSLSTAEIERLVSSQERSAKAATVRKSVWRYIERTYGLKKVAEIVYFSRMARSIDYSFNAVLGYGVETLTENWLQFVRENYRGAPSIEAASPIPMTGGRIAGAALHPRRAGAAYIVEKEGAFKLKTFFFKGTDGDTRTLAAFGLKTGHSAWSELRLPVAWSPSGAALAFIGLKGAEPQLVYLTLKGRKTEEYPLGERFDAVLDLAWSPDGRSLVVAAQKNGYTDLYITPAMKADFSALTNDPFDDRHPAFSEDGKWLFFVSNRDSILEKPPTTDYRFLLKNGFDLYGVQLAKKNRPLTRFTQTPFAHETRPFFQDSAVHFLTDAIGLPNVRRIYTTYFNAEDSSGVFVTGFSGGIEEIQSSKSGQMPAGYERGELKYYWFKPKTFSGPTAPAYHSLARERKKAAVKKRIDPQQEQAVKLRQILRLEPTDTAATDTTPAKTPRYYVFDEGEDETRQRRQNVRRRSKEAVVTLTAKPVFDINKVRVADAGAARAMLIHRGFDFSFERDPVLNFAAHLRARLEDPFERHRLSLRFRTYWNLRSADGGARYEYVAGKTRWFVGLEGLNYFYRVDSARVGNTEQFLQHYRWRVFDAYLGATLPFERRHELTLCLGAASMTRYDLLLYDNLNRDGREVLGRARVEYRWNQVRTIDRTPVQGWWTTAWVQGHYALRQRISPYWQIGAEVRRYTLLGKIVLAQRFLALAHPGPHAPPIFLGGYAHWPFGEFLNPQELPFSGNPVRLAGMVFALPFRGFAYNARNGVQMGMLNLEARIPVFGLRSKTTLPVRPMYRTLLCVFYDVGTAWTTGNPFSTRNPIDAKRIDVPPFTIVVQSLKTPFVMGFGLGFQMYWFNLPARVDLAFPIEDGRLQKAQFALSFSRPF